jgi:hypothetical protein
LVIDLEEAGWEYSVHLERADGDLFRGSWTCQDGSRTETGSASARLYTSGDGSLLLFGDWVQNGDRSHWWAELTAVEHFPDEVQD